MQIAGSKLQIERNPTRGAVHLGFTAGARRVAVVDAAGRVRLERAIGPNDTRAELDLGPLGRGVYIVRLDRSGGCEARAVVRH